MWAINSAKQISPLLLVSAARNIRSIASWPPAGVILRCIYGEIVLFWGVFDEFVPRKGCSYGSRGFLEDRMMDTITGRAPPPARAGSHVD